MIVIAGADLFFMKRGDQASQDALMEALSQFGVGSASMADDFLNSGNTMLERSGEEWGARRGYREGVRDGRRVLYMIMD